MEDAEGALASGPGHAVDLQWPRPWAEIPALPELVSLSVQRRRSQSAPPGITATITFWSLIINRLLIPSSRHPVSSFGWGQSVPPQASQEVPHPLSHQIKPLGPLAQHPLLTSQVPSLGKSRWSCKAAEHAIHTLVTMPRAICHLPFPHRPNVSAPTDLPKATAPCHPSA